jgi:Cys-tRNA(Pro) deacylase
MKADYPSTPAVHFLRGKKITFVPHLYPYEEHGGTGRAAAMLGVDEHAVVKTLVMQTDPRHALLVLMHGDREVSTKELARALGVKHVEPADVDVAQKHTGYLVGGISPFGTRSPMPVYVEETVLELPRIYINGGRRGFLVEVDPRDVQAALGAQPVRVAIEP